METRTGDESKETRTEDKRTRRE